MDTENSTLQDQAYERLRRGIIFSELKPGERLVAKDLCERLQMGRTPVREAIVRLQQDRLVRTVPQSGTFVSQVDLKAAECSRFMREHMEREVAMECCAKVRPEDAAYLARIIALEEAAVRERNQRDFFTSDNLLHQAFFEIAGRRRVWDWLNAASTDLERYRWLRVETEGLAWDTIMDQHYRLRDAIVGHDPHEADFLVALHLHMMFDDKASVVTKFPEYFATDESA